MGHIGSVWGFLLRSCMGNDDDDPLCKILIREIQVILGNNETLHFTEASDYPDLVDIFDGMYVPELLKDKGVESTNDIQKIDIYLNDEFTVNGRNCISTSYATGWLYDPIDLKELPEFGIRFNGCDYVLGIQYDMEQPDTPDEYIQFFAKVKQLEAKYDVKLKELGLYENCCS